MWQVPGHGPPSWGRYGVGKGFLPGNHQAAEALAGNLGPFCSTGLAHSFLAAPLLPPRRGESLWLGSGGCRLQSWPASGPHHLLPNPTVPHAPALSPHSHQTPHLPGSWLVALPGPRCGHTVSKPALPSAMSILPLARGARTPSLPSTPSTQQFQQGLSRPLRSVLQCRPGGSSSLHAWVLQGPWGAWVTTHPTGPAEARAAEELCALGWDPGQAKLSILDDRCPQ